MAHATCMRIGTRDFIDFTKRSIKDGARSVLKLKNLKKRGRLQRQSSAQMEKELVVLGASKLRKSHIAVRLFYK